MSLPFYAPFVFLLSLFSILLVKPAEDAVILYEYSKTLAETGIISYGRFGAPIEGATDFLWMIIIAIFSYAGLEEFYSASILNSLAAVYLFKKITTINNNKIIGVTALIFTPYLWSSTQGFSAITFSAIYVFCIQAYLKKNDSQLYFSVLILCLFRPDGVLWGAPLIALNQLSNGIDLRKFKKLIFLLILPGIVYFVWRLQYFGELLPLPFYVKASESAMFTYFLAVQSRWLCTASLHFNLLCL